MKKLFTVIALAVITATAAHAQFGVIGGFTSSRTSIDTDNWDANLKGVSLMHVGVAYKMDFGPVAIQPALTYQMKGSEIQDDKLTIGTLQNFAGSLESSTGYLELSAGLQLGLDLLMCRPYVFVEPFAGYAITGDDKVVATASGVASGSVDLQNIDSAVDDVKNKLEYGFGIGAGVEFLERFQLSLQWFKNLGSLYDNGKIDSEAKLTAIRDEVKEVNNYQGIKISLAVFF